MYSIVVIEDEASYRGMIEVILQMEGFQVRTAADGDAGLALLREKRADLILCDVMMPGTDGHGVLQTLKEDSTLADIPFIFVSALAEREQVRGGMSAGADDYLSKPFSAEELLAAVTGRLRRHELIKSSQGRSDLAKERSLLRDTISRREREVLLMVGRGASSKEIAASLGVSQKTIEAHRASLMRKLDAGNAVGLARWAAIAESR